MKQRNLTQQTGFTMVEIIVATIVFTLTFAGILAAVSSLNKPSVEAFEDVQASYIAQEIADELRQTIDAEFWDETDPAQYNLVPDTTYPIGPITRNNITFSGTYNVIKDNRGGRWVDIEITWN